MIMPGGKQYDSGFTFQGFFGMSPDEKAAYEHEHPFPDQSIEEYIDAVVEWLQTSSWKYSKEEALQCLKSIKNRYSATMSSMFLLIFAGLKPVLPAENADTNKMYRCR